MLLQEEVFGRIQGVGVLVTVARLATAKVLLFTGSKAVRSVDNRLVLPVVVRAKNYETL